MEKINQMFQSALNVNPIENYLFAILIFIIIIILVKLTKQKLLKKISEISEKSTNKIDDLIIPTIVNISNAFYYLLALYISTKILIIPDHLSKILSGLLFLFVIYETIIIVKNIFHLWVTKKIEKNNTKSTVTILGAIEKFFNFFLWIIAIFFLLSHYGVNINTLVAGFGIGGIAIAFAFKSILQDIFAYFSIVLDQPIKEGDYIKTAELKGTVKRIGIKSTRLKALEGKEIIIPNDKIISEKLENYGDATYRRISIIIGVSYDTPVPKLKEIKKELQKIVESFEKTKFIRCHLKSLADWSLEFELVYNIANRNYITYMDTNESINLQILQYFKKAKIEIPYPTRTVYNR